MRKYRAWRALLCHLPVDATVSPHCIKMKVVAVGWLMLALSSTASAEFRTTFSERGLLDLILPKPLVSSTLLQLTISSNNLLKHAKNLYKFANDNGGTRAFGSKGHNATVNYIKKLLDDTKYYDTELQTFPYLFSEGTSKFSANGTDYATSWFTYGPAGDVTAPIVVVNNLGCDLVSTNLLIMGLPVLPAFFSAERFPRSRRRKNCTYQAWNMRVRSQDRSSRCCRCRWCYHLQPRRRSCWLRNTWCNFAASRPLRAYGWALRN